MGCCIKRNYLLDKIDIVMTDFYFRLVRHDFVINKIQEFNKSSKNYHDFWELTKLLGIHSHLPFQTRFWETAYVDHAENSLDGLLCVFLLLCNGDIFNKLEYLKYYLSVNINLSKENDLSLIMHCQEFKKILYVYFSCISSIPLNTFIKVKKINDASSEILSKEHYNEEVIKSFTDFIIQDYVKKNFYVNAGKFLDQNINFLCDDKIIRKTIFKFKLSQSYLNTKKLTSDSNSARTGRALMDIHSEEKPLKSNSKKSSGCCCRKKKQKKKGFAIHSFVIPKKKAN
jgi:hypothetical protein